MLVRSQNNCSGYIDLKPVRSIAINGGYSHSAIAIWLYERDRRRSSQGHKSDWPDREQFYNYYSTLYSRVSIDRLAFMDDRSIVDVDGQILTPGLSLEFYI